jgi:hypothetical protein
MDEDIENEDGNDLTEDQMIYIQMSLGCDEYSDYEA